MVKRQKSWRERRDQKEVRPIAITFSATGSHVILEFDRRTGSLHLTAAEARQLAARLLRTAETSDGIHVDERQRAQAAVIHRAMAERMWAEPGDGGQ